LTQNTLWFDQVSISDVEKVGGKNASLGEMISNLSGLGVSVPMGLQQPPMPIGSFFLIRGWMRALMRR